MIHPRLGNFVCSNRWSSHRYLTDLSLNSPVPLLDLCGCAVLFVVQLLLGLTTRLVVGASSCHCMRREWT